MNDDRLVGMLSALRTERMERAADQQLRARGVAHGEDAAAGDGEVADLSRGTGAVDDEATADHEVERHENASFGPCCRERWAHSSHEAV